jgi:hypothetical protein
MAGNLAAYNEIDGRERKTCFPALRREKLMKNVARKIVFEAVKPENLIRAREMLRQFNYVTSPLDDGIYLAEYKSYSLSVSNCEGTINLRALLS